MTSLGIRTGRALSSATSTVSVAAGATVVLAAAHADRVALSVALPAVTEAALDGLVSVGYLIEGVFCPLTCLSEGHPACYLSVDKIGTAILPAISARNASTGTLVLGVTEVRQTQDLP